MGGLVAALVATYTLTWFCLRWALPLNFRFGTATHKSQMATPACRWSRSYPYFWRTCPKYRPILFLRPRRPRSWHLKLSSPHAGPCLTSLSARRIWSHIELCGLVLSSRPLVDGRSPQSRAADRSWVSRFIVRAPVGTLQQRYFAEYGTSAARIMSQLALRQRNPMDSTAVINMVCGPAGEPMVRALEECHQDTNLYRNALDRLSRAAELMPAERAEAVLVLFVAVGCSADVRSSVNYAIDYAHATCGGGTSTPRSLGMSMTAGEREPAPAHPFGLAARTKTVLS